MYDNQVNESVNQSISHICGAPTKARLLLGESVSQILSLRITKINSHLFLNILKSWKLLKLHAEKKMVAKFIENEILGTSRKCSKDEEKGGTSAGQNSGCEISREG